jgi:hypothetical protein
MKILLTALVLSSLPAFAHEESAKPKAEESVETIVKKSKKERKKKVEMCHECGKPEVQCDCEGEEHKKSE